VQLKTERLADKAANTNLGYQTLPDLAVQAQTKRRWIICAASSKSFTGPVIFSVESEGRREALSEMLARIKSRRNIFCGWKKPPATAAI
jgi:transcription-repair coupling factor (superfamily II helicase)